MLRIFITSYHIFIGIVAVSLLLALVVTVSFFLVESLLSYFFSIDLIDWIHRATGLDLRAVIAGSNAVGASVIQGSAVFLDRTEAIK